MKQVVCNYAPIRFLPYRDSGEFINAGIVVHCPQTDFFGFRTVPAESTRRVTAFFPELDLTVFKAALEGINRELRRAQTEHKISESGKIPYEVALAQMARFTGLVRKREGLIHFGDAGTIMAVNGEEALDALFARHVERNFEKRPEHQEREIVGSTRA